MYNKLHKFNVPYVSVYFVNYQIQHIVFIISYQHPYLDIRTGLKLSIKPYKPTIFYFEIDGFSVVFFSFVLVLSYIYLLRARTTKRNKIAVLRYLRTVEKNINGAYMFTALNGLTLRV